MKTKTIFVLVLFSVFFVSSCKKSKDASVNDYVGTWNVTDNYKKNYTMTITASGSTLTLSKLQDCFIVTASVSGNNLTIANQTLNSSTSSCGYPYTINGSGTISGSKFNTLQITYAVTDNSGQPVNNNCTATK